MTTDYKDHHCSVCQKKYSDAQDAIQCCSDKKTLSQKAEAYFVAATEESYQKQKSKKDQ